MKTIGIVTLIGNNNYGNRLQNYATQKICENLNYDATTILNVYGLNDKTSKIKFTIKILKYIYSRAKYYLFKCNYKRLKRFKEFDKNIKFTNKINTIYNVYKNNFDYYIVGSDQVWKPTYGRLSELDLLKFADPNKRISFSASFGIESLPERFKEKAKKELLQFKALSVREAAGKRIVEELTSRNDIELLIDPTMLLNKEEWNKVSKKPRQLESIKEKKYILNYFLGSVNDEIIKKIKDFARKNDYHIINILDKRDPFYETGPSEFLYLEENASLICTDSFHSSVFAIIYDTPFIVFDREDKKDNMNSRIDTLLSKFKLENRRYIGKEITKENLNHDYTEAYKILEKERKKSEEFLKKALDIE